MPQSANWWPHGSEVTIGSMDGTATCPMCGTALVTGSETCHSCGESVSASREPVVDFAKAKRRRLLWLLVLWTASGVLDPLLADAEIAGLLPLALGVATTVLVISWCQVDARERDFTIRPWLFVTLFFLTCLGVPIYLLRTRGARGVFSIVLAFLFALLMGVLEVAALQITRFAM